MNKKYQSKDKVKEEQKSALQISLENLNCEIEKLGDCSLALSTALNDIQTVFDGISNVPSENKIEYEKLKKIRLAWHSEANDIKKIYDDAMKKEISNAEIGVSLGLGFGALAPSAAMGIATTFGVSSTGTAISTLSGEVAKRAALAWLGGGALSAGGGGIAAGQALLATAGPIGLAISSASFIFSGIKFYLNKKNRQRATEIHELIDLRTIKQYELATIEVDTRIEKVLDETPKIIEGIDIIKAFGTNYDKMSEKQKYALGSYFNLMKASTQLLVNPILGLLPNYTEKDFECFLSYIEDNYEDNIIIQSIRDHKDIVLYFANLFESIPLNKKDIKILTKEYKKNKDLLKNFEMLRIELNSTYIEAAISALKYKEIQHNTSVEEKSEELITQAI